MAHFNQSLTGVQTFSATISRNRWYIGTFKESSAGVIRAISRAIHLITQKQD